MNATVINRATSLLAIGLTLAVAETGLGNDEAGKIVFVSAEQAPVRSGPSEADYPTGVLKRGETVQTFLKTKDGWLAIRPPEGSFSWVPARDGYLLSGGRTLEITGSKAVSWIGTTLGAAKQYRWQVELSEGEQLTIVGEATRKNAAGDSELWYKVSPPSGEFRWIHEKFTAADLGKDAPKKISPESAKPLAEHGAASDATDSQVSRNAEQIPRGNPHMPTGVTPAAYQSDDVFGSASLAPIPQQQRAPVGNPPSARSRPSGNNSARAQDRWSGWSAWNLGDDGLRFQLFNKLRGGLGRVAKDPRSADPFDLSMTTEHIQKPAASPMDMRGNLGDRSRETYFADNATSSTPRNSIASSGTNVSTPAQSKAPSPAASASSSETKERPWRDPRLLAEKRRIQRNRDADNAASSSNDRIASYDTAPARDREVPALQPQPPASDLIATIRESVGALGGNLRSGLGVSTRPRDIPSREADASFREASTANNKTVDWYGVSNSSDRDDSRPSRSLETPDTFSAPSTQVDLLEIQADLTAMVSRSPETWSLEDLVGRTKQLIQHGTTPIERGQARILLERIEEFQQHAKRTALTTLGGVSSASYRQPASSNRPSNSTYAVTASYQASPAQGRSLPKPKTIGGKQPYDATGWLVPVYAATKSQPNFALTNEAGAIVAYVTALPGMNLSVYVNKPVGIIGLRGYVDSLQAGYIEAERVFVLR